MTTSTQQENYLSNNQEENYLPDNMEGEEDGVDNFDGFDETQNLLLPIPASSVTSVNNRVFGFDLFRGLIMIFESIDHSREFLSKIEIAHEEWFNVPNYYDHRFNENMPFLAWFLRSLTGLCAPGFFFLMGLGAVYFTESRRKIGWSNARIYRHFAIRCGVLVFLNFVHFPFLMFMQPGKVTIILTVLYALGINIFLGSLILSAELAITEACTYLLQKARFDEYGARATAFWISCSGYIIACFSLTTFVSVYHNSLTLPPDIKSYNPGDWLLMTFIPCSQCDSVVFSIYPFIPWLTPMIWGIFFGRLYTRFRLNTFSKIRINILTGLTLLLIFVTLRTSTDFGSIHSSLLDPPLHKDFISFMNLTKYPPSLTYLCWTMGINHLLMAACLAMPQPSDYNPVLVFGKSALFFYVMHFYVYALDLVLITLAGVSKGENGRSVLGFSMYLLAWSSGLVLLYPLCYWYGLFKSKKGPDSIWKFF